MSRMLVSKKGRVIVPLLLLGVLLVAIGIMLLTTGEMDDHHYGNSEFEDMLQNMLPFLILFGGGMIVVMALNASKCSISVYDDHIEGVAQGKSGMGLSNFYFTKEMHYSVQLTGKMVQVSCGSEVYKVPLSQQDAQEVYRCAKMGVAAQTPQKPVRAPQPSPQQPATSKIIACHHCHAHLRVPAGKGTIRVTCPKCQNKIQINT